MADKPHRYHGALFASFFVHTRFLEVFIMTTTVRKGVKTLPTLLLISTSYIAVFTSIQGFKAMLPLVEEEFGISGAQAGLYSTFFYTSGVILAIFSGRIVDKLGSRAGLLFGAFTIGVLMVLHALSPAFFVLLILALVTGVGFTIVTPSVNKAIVYLVDPSKRAVSNGLVHAGGGVGGIVGASILPSLGETFGWRPALLVASAIAFVMTAILWRFFTVDTNGDDNEEEDETTSFKEDMLRLIRNRAAIMTTFIGLLMGTTLGNMTIHYTLFLTGDMGFSPSLAGIALSLFIFGGIIGNPGVGFINDKFLGSNRRLGIMLQGLVITGMFLIMAFILFPTQPHTAILLTFSFLFGMMGFAIIGLLFTSVADTVDSKLLGTATGVALLFARLAMVITPPIVGRIADVSGNYQMSWLFVAGLALAVVLTFFFTTRNHKDDLYGSRASE